MPNAGMLVAVWVSRMTLNVAVGMLRGKKSPDARVTALFSVGMSGVLETFGPRSAWVRISALVVVRVRYVSRIISNHSESLRIISNQLKSARNELSK